MEELISVQADTPPPVVDPNLAAEQQQAQSDLATSLGQQSQGDMASLMARYGTRLAMAGANTGSPLVTTPAVGAKV